MRTYVSTIGHYSPRVMRPILDNGLDADDVVVLLRPRGDTSDRAKSAIQDVDQTVNELGPGSDIVVEEVSHEAFEAVVLECVDIPELECEVDDIRPGDRGDSQREQNLPRTPVEVEYHRSLGGFKDVDAF